MFKYLTTLHHIASRLSETEASITHHDLEAKNVPFVLKFFSRGSYSLRTGRGEPKMLANVATLHQTAYLWHTTGNIGGGNKSFFRLTRTGSSSWQKWTKSKKPATSALLLLSFHRRNLHACFQDQRQHRKPNKRARHSTCNDCLTIMLQVCVQPCVRNRLHKDREHTCHPSHNSAWLRHYSQMVCTKGSPAASDGLHQR
jgi:hypothetical protein